MKMTKKKVVVVAVAICLAAILSLGSLAWFNYTDAVNNKFEISSSLTDFKIDVWEEVPDGDDEGTDPDEVGKNVLTADEVSYTYDEVGPGDKFLKRVHVTNTSPSELATQYIQVVVTFTNYTELHAMSDSDEPFDCTEMLLGQKFSEVEDETNAELIWWYDSENVVYDANADTASYIFYLRDVLNPGEDVVLFEEVEIPETMDINDAANLRACGGFQINVVANAIQSANLEKSATATDLENAVWAFETAWERRDESPVATYPVTTTVTPVTTAPERT